MSRSSLALLVVLAVAAVAAAAAGCGDDGGPDITGLYVMSSHMTSSHALNDMGARVAAP